MNRSAIDLNQLRVLHELLADGSVSKAAARLGVTQAAASNALRRLRAHYGDELLTRSGQRMVRTHLAVSLRPLVAKALEAATEVFAEPSSFLPSKAAAQLRIATSDHIDAVVLEPFSRMLARDAPGVTLVVESFSPASAERVLKGDVDLLIAPRSNMSGDFHAARLLEEPFAVVVRAGHPVTRKRFGIHEFAHLRHILVSPGGGTRASLDKTLATHGLKRTIQRYSPTFSYALLLVAESDLVATVPWSLAARYAKSLRLRLLPLPVTAPPVRVDLGWSSRMDADPLHRWVRQQLIATAKVEIARLVPEP